MRLSRTAADNLALLERVWRQRLSGRLHLEVDGREERLAVVSGGVYPGADGLHGLREAAAHGRVRFLVAPGEPIAQPGSRPGLAGVIRELATRLVDQQPRPVEGDAIVRLQADIDLAYEIIDPYLADRLFRKPVAAGALLRDGTVSGRLLQALERLHLVKIERPALEAAADPGGVGSLPVETTPPPVRPSGVRAPGSRGDDPVGGADVGTSWRVAPGLDGEDAEPLACEPDAEGDADPFAFGAVWDDDGGEGADDGEEQADDDDSGSAIAVLTPDEDDLVFACEEDTDDPSSSAFTTSAGLLNAMLGEEDAGDPWALPPREEPEVEIEDDESWLGSSLEPGGLDGRDLDSGLYSAVDTAGSTATDRVAAEVDWGGVDLPGGEAAFEAPPDDDDPTLADLPVVGECAADALTDPGDAAEGALVDGTDAPDDLDAVVYGLEEPLDEDEPLFVEGWTGDDDGAAAFEDDAVARDDAVASDPPGTSSSPLPVELIRELSRAELGISDDFLGEMQVELVNRARRELLAGAYEEAAATLERCDALRPGDPAVRVHRAWARMLAGERVLARAEAEAAMALAPSDPLVRHLAEALVARIEG